jgi:DNA-binding response OmpR family regulator
VVLAMDDALRATIHQTLEVLGYRVTVAADTEELVDAVAAEPTDLVVVDGLADNEALARARALRPSLRLIATAHPGRAPEPVAGASIAALTKPFTLADLARKVRRTLDGAGEAS